MKEIIDKIELYEAESEAKFINMVETLKGADLTNELSGLIGTMQAQMNVIKIYLKIQNDKS